MYDDSTPCACGHVFDEHDPESGECQAELANGEGCICVYFEEDEG